MYDMTLLDVPQDAQNPDNSSTSSSIICVCCNCDRVRMRSGNWVDDHTPSRSERRTHGLCHDCFANLYPEFSDLGVR
jgi:hypothetical protein